jgi:hypothetical protein
MIRRSATQISTAELCLRRWAWPRLDKIPKVPNRFAQASIDAHAEAERWLSTGVVPALPHVQALVKFLPPPGTPGLRVEQRLDFELEGIPFVGYIDALNTTSDPLRVYDHKFTGNLHYAIPSDELHGDVQASLYAHAVMTLFHVERVGLQWTYAKRGSRQVAPSSAVVTRADIAERLALTAHTARSLALIPSTMRALDLPYSADACEAYGGCPFQSQCNLSPKEKMRSIMSQNSEKDNFFAEMRARQQGATVHPINATPVINPPPLEVPLSVAVEAPAEPPPAPKKRGRPPKAAAPVSDEVVASSPPPEPRRHEAPAVHMSSTRAAMSPELGALWECSAALETLDPPARRRVVEALAVLVA